jgi:hypothetical protein
MVAHGRAFSSRFVVQAGVRLSAAAGRASTAAQFQYALLGGNQRAFHGRRAPVGVALNLAQRRAGVHTEAAVAAAAAAANAATAPVTAALNGHGNGNADLASAMANPPPSIQSVIVKLLQTLSSKKEGQSHGAWVSAHLRLLNP